MKLNIVITGGAGLIGSHVVRLFVNRNPEYHIINLDNLTYAGNLANLKGIEKTVRWYPDNQECLDNVTSGDYQNYFTSMYVNR